MATRVHDQGLVETFGETYGKEKPVDDGVNTSPEAVACFGKTLEPGDRGDKVS